MHFLDIKGERSQLKGILTIKGAFFHCSSEMSNHIQEGFSLSDLAFSMPSQEHSREINEFHKKMVSISTLH